MMAAAEGWNILWLGFVSKKRNLCALMKNSLLTLQFTLHTRECLSLRRHYSFRTEDSSLLGCHAVSLGKWFQHFEGTEILQNIRNCSPKNMVQHLIGHKPSATLLWEPPISVLELVPLSDVALISVAQMCDCNQSDFSVTVLAIGTLTEWNIGSYSTS